MGCTPSKIASDKSPFRGFTGEVFYRDYNKDSEYALRKYQYALSSYPDGSMEPAIIFYPKNEEDVKKVINYARKERIAIAIRTGGHQYCGSSSTSGRNIQIDLSKTFREFEYDKSTNRLRTGISFTLRELNAELGHLGLFIPHGECQNVHVGGHLHTGGYGMLYRSYGLFGDHVRVLELITADGVKKTATRDNEHSDLFYAVLGGCPGSFAIVTHIVIEPHRDIDHPNSRGFFGTYLYEENRFHRLLNLAKEYANDDYLPIDFDFTITILSFNQDFIELYPGIDQIMRTKHPTEQAKNCESFHLYRMKDMKKLVNRDH
jgi:hypothetical protein